MYNMVFKQFWSIIHRDATLIEAEHTTNLATGVSRQPVLDCETIFHLDCSGWDFPSILS